MNFHIHKSLWTLFCWFIQITYQLECLECTGFMTYNTRTSDSSCLDGTSVPVRCKAVRNESDAQLYQCISSVYRGGLQGIAGIYINRGCVIRRKLQHDCDPPHTFIDIESNGTFYCSYACEGNACNRHAVDFILSNENSLYSNKFFIFNSIFLVFIGCKLL